LAGAGRIRVAITVGPAASVLARPVAASSVRPVSSRALSIAASSSRLIVAMKEAATEAVLGAEAAGRAAAAVVAGLVLAVVPLPAGPRSVIGRPLTASSTAWGVEFVGNRRSTTVLPSSSGSSGGWWKLTLLPFCVVTVTLPLAALSATVPVMTLPGPAASCSVWTSGLFSSPLARAARMLRISGVPSAATATGLVTIGGRAAGLVSVVTAASAL
jgi:hypothetical protein